MGIAAEQYEDIGQVVIAKVINKNSMASAVLNKNIYLDERVKQPKDIGFQGLVSQDCPGQKWDREPPLPRLKKAPDKFAKLVLLDKVMSIKNNDIDVSRGGTSEGEHVDADVAFMAQCQHTGLPSLGFWLASQAGLKLESCPPVMFVLVHIVRVVGHGEHQHDDQGHGLLHGLQGLEWSGPSGWSVSVNVWFKAVKLNLECGECIDSKCHEFFFCYSTTAFMNSRLGFS